MGRFTLWLVPHRLYELKLQKLFNKFTLFYEQFLLRNDRVVLVFAIEYGTKCICFEINHIDLGRTKLFD